jgi:hypothetical protein
MIEECTVKRLVHSIVIVSAHLFIKPHHLGNRPPELTPPVASLQLLGIS